MPSYRSKASFGKRQEYKAIAKLLELGYDVYLTLVDDQGIDCIIRHSSGKKYFDVQIKASSKKVKPDDAAFFANIRIGEPRENYIFIFYSEILETYWVIESTELIHYWRNKTGKYKGSYNIKFNGNSKKKGGVYKKEEFGKYEDKFCVFD